MYTCCISGCCLPSSANTALINPLSPHTSLWLSTPTMRRVNWMNPPFPTAVLSQVPEMSHLSYSSFPLLPETQHSAQGCLHLLFPSLEREKGRASFGKRPGRVPWKLGFLFITGRNQSAAELWCLASAQSMQEAMWFALLQLLPALPAIPILWLLLHHVCPAAELGTEVWSLSPPWGAMLSGAVPLWHDSGCPQPSLVPVLEKKNTGKLRGIK